jgi:hypothetical protein
MAKDVHAIYSPYLSSSTKVRSGFDICNGMFYDSIGNYAYFATTTYPDITGCFEPGNYPNFLPNCTTNPPTSYIKSSFATSFSTSSGAALNIQIISFFMMLQYTLIMLLL